MGIFRYLFLPGMISAGLIVAIYAYVSWRFNWAALKSPGAARIRRLSWIGNDSIAEIYRETLLGTVLDYTGSKMGDFDLLAHPETRTNLHNLFVAPLTTASFEFCIKCAFVYPIVSIFVFWVAGASNSVGAYPLLPPGDQLGIVGRLLYLAVVGSTVGVGGFAFLQAHKLGGEQ